MTTNITPKERQYPAYKSSGSRLLGNVPDHWGTPRLKKHLLMNDSGVWSDEPDDEGTIVIRSTEQTVGGQWHLENPARLRLPETQRRSATLERSDLVITKSSGSRDHIGKTTIVTDEIANLGCCFSNFMQRIKVDQHLDPNLLWRYLNNYVGREQLLAEATTTTGLANLNAKIVGNCRIPVPPPDEQASIVRFLDHADEQIQHYIAGKKRLIALLEEERQAVIHQAVTRGLDPNVKLKPSGVEWLGDVPEHWEIGPLKRFAARYSGAIKAGPFGSQLTSADMTGTDFKVYTQRNVIDRDLEKGFTYISNAKFHDLRAFEIVPGDVLVTSRGTIGRTALVANSCERGVLHPCLLRIHPDHERLVPEFLMTLIQDSQLLPQQLMFLSNSTTIDVIYSSTLANTVVPVPPLTEQVACVEHLDRVTSDIDTAINSAHRQIDLMNEYRTRLIADVVTGQLDVREAAEELPTPEPTEITN